MIFRAVNDIFSIGTLGSNSTRMLGKRKPGGLAPVFVFTLRVADDSGVTDVVCAGREAEHFLGVKAAQFRKNAGVRRAVLEALQRCIAEKMSIPATLWSYRVQLPDKRNKVAKDR